MFDPFIAKHTNALARVLVGIFAVWFIGGLALVDYLNPVVFMAIWIPVGLAGAWFAYKW